MTRIQLITVCCLSGIVPPALLAQGGGSYAGSNSYGYSATGSSPSPASVTERPLTTEEALSVIQISGRAQVRVAYEGIRVVIALTAQGQSADDCRTHVQQQIRSIRQDLQQMGLRESDIVEDFINVLPVYQWKKSERDEEQVRIQTQSGYRTQSNLHIAVETEAQALDAIRRVHQHGDCEVITFDYWSSDLDQQKEAARELAVASAQKKAKTLLAVFEKRPPVINVQEHTKVRFPQELYRTFENVLQEELTEYRSDRTTRIKAFRPRMTFFEGAKGQPDVHESTPAMGPEIVVESTVRIYYRSPADGNAVGR